MEELELRVIIALDADTGRQIEALRDRVERADGVDPLSEHKRSLLRLALEGAPDGSTPPPDDTVVGIVATRSGSADLVGYAQLCQGGTDGSLAVELAVTPELRGPGIGVADALLDTALRAAQRDDLPFDPDGPPPGGERTVRYWVHRATPDDDRLAADHGLGLERELLQLRRPLPVEGPRTSFAVRPFVPGVDEAAWLAVNNRAFATHPEQGGWTMDMVLEHEREPWFDPDGFLLHEEDGRLAASCWTKVHRHGTVPMGEIYVISVDPDFHGRGLGRSMTLAGLDWLNGAGLRVGMLYVDGANSAATSLYHSMGFVEHQVDRAYAGTVAVVDSRGDLGAGR